MSKPKTNSILNIAILVISFAISLLPIYILFWDQDSLKFLLRSSNTTGFFGNLLFIYAIVGGAGIGYYIAQTFTNRSKELRYILFTTCLILFSIVMFIIYIFAGLSAWK